MKPDSQVETFAAVRLEIHSWRWQGVPFYIRAGKSLPVTCTEVLVRLRRPPASSPTRSRAELRAHPGRPRGDDRPRRHGDGRGGEGVGQPVELLASHHPASGEMDAYERVLGDAMAGDSTLFAREDYVEEAWRIVDPVLKAARALRPALWQDEQCHLCVKIFQPPGKIGGIGSPGGDEQKRTDEQEAVSKADPRGRETKLLSGSLHLETDEVVSDGQAPEFLADALGARLRSASSRSRV